MDGKIVKFEIVKRGWEWKISRLPRRFEKGMLNGKAAHTG